MSKLEANWCRKIEIWWLLRGIKKYYGYKYKHTTVFWGEDGPSRGVSIEVFINNNDKYARLTYTHTDGITGVKKEIDHTVPIVETPCHFGGTRHWFKCSLFRDNQYCGRRVGVLYKVGAYFGCRHCHELTYSSRLVSRQFKLSRPIIQEIEREAKIRKLNQKARRYTYKGKITKRQQKLEELYSQHRRNY